MRLKQKSVHGVVESTDCSLRLPILLRGIWVGEMKVSAVVAKKIPRKGS